MPRQNQQARILRILIIVALLVVLVRGGSVLGGWAVVFAMWLPFLLVGGLAFWAFHRFTGGRQGHVTGDAATSEKEHTSSLRVQPNDAALMAYSLGFVSGG